MRSGKKIGRTVLCAVGLMLLILDSKTAVHSAYTGIEVCIRSVIPALFPFLVLSSVLISSLNGRHLRFLSLLSAPLGIPNGAEGIFLTGLIGGYPTGAHCVAQAYSDGQLSRSTAQRMLGFCSNAGASFIFGICSPLFASKVAPWALWGIHILSAIVVGMLLPQKNASPNVRTRKGSLSFTSALRHGVISMSQICGWIVLFRVLIGFLDRWMLWLFPEEARCLILGCLELTNGCLELNSVTSEGLQFVLCSSLLALGGLCINMQTVTAVGSLGLGMYIPGKLLQCLISLILAGIMQCILYASDITLLNFSLPGALLAILITLLIPYRTFYKKRGSFSV